MSFIGSTSSRLVMATINDGGHVNVDTISNRGQDTCVMIHSVGRIGTIRSGRWWWDE